MSILNGNVSDSAVYPESQRIGGIMSPVSKIDEPSVAVAALGDDIIICGGKRISLYRLSEDGSDTFISSFEICGKARQIAQKDGFAFISARESGLYVCDLTVPEHPEIVCNIDTIELATGVAVAGDILAVTNRHMGCELFDVSTPLSPKRIGHFMCGEAQSVCLFEHYAVIGDWMNKRARIFDISDVTDVKELSQLRVDGFADGVCTFQRDGKTFCAVATGHHSERLKNRRKYECYTYLVPEMLDCGYGCGHGVEIYDVTDPQMPEWMSVLKTPPHFGGPDTWLVYTDGENIVFTDSMNGIFVISVKDVHNPEIINSYKLPPLNEQRISPPSIQIQTASITSAAYVKGFLCTASEQEGVHILKNDANVKNFLTQSVNAKIPSQKKSDKAFYTSNGQIHAFVQYGNKIYCASGNEGIEVLDKSGQLVYKRRTQGICRDVILYDGMLVSAESDCGIAVYDTDSTLTEKSRILWKNAPIRQIVKTQSGIAAVSGVSCILFFERDEKSIFKLYAEQGIRGILYHRHLFTAPNENGALANPLSVGPTLMTQNLKNVNKSVLFSLQFCPFADGSCSVGDKLITVYQKSYSVCTSPYTKIAAKKIEGAWLQGQPFVVDGKLVLLNRYTGGVEVFDISDIETPILLKQVTLPHHPEFCGSLDGLLYVACGFGGIVKL